MVTGEQLRKGEGGGGRFQVTKYRRRNLRFSRCPIIIEKDVETLRAAIRIR